MNYVRWAILALLLLQLPGFFLFNIGPSLGSLSSYLTSGLLLVYFFFAQPKHRLFIPFIVLGILFFTFSTFNFSSEDETEFIKSFLRFMIVVACGNEVVQRTNNRDLLVVLIVGGLSIIIHGVVFPDAYTEFSTVTGRASGFYLNPNYAGTVALVGYSLSLASSSKRLRWTGMLIFSLAGLLTLSRTFIVIWVIINLIASVRSRKNLLGFAVGGAMVILILTVSTFLELNTERFSALESLFSNNVQTETITKDTRMDTWAKYTPKVWEAPIFGNGYNKLRGKQYGGSGIHNTYLMVWGESGILPFLFLMGLYFYLVLGCLKYFDTNPEYLYVIIVIALAMLASHGYFESFFMVFISMFVYARIRDLKKQELQPPPKATAST
ncbi:MULTISPECIES: O-antigen ligase family protein [unclassified Robiginitalea]|uniref:O-antigen ligase family protein n=1 Tax=Robiginitalea TaxID=252306 RepID=UPI002349C262|nr:MULTISPECIES: O-antigen ligase family protein [unclassified Robiginitalea]MDC6353824.1 O-antigen ligase family protein [Robiginitalea sp. PM2]MDC6374091.1 O-antigen ligase family protein [Robiginitalea sp. SP8]